MSRRRNRGRTKQPTPLSDGEGIEPTVSYVVISESRQVLPTPKIDIICIGGPHDGKFGNVDPSLEFPMVNGAQYERMFFKFETKYFFALVFYNPANALSKDDVLQMLLAGYRGASVNDKPMPTTKLPTGRKFDFSE